MFKNLICLALISGCSNISLVEPDGCKPNPRIPTVQTDNICIESLRCVTDGQVTLSNYACFCDNLCICFFSITNDCLDDIECEKLGGTIAILGDAFCTIKYKKEILEQLNKEVERMLG